MTATSPSQHSRFARAALAAAAVATMIACGGGTTPGGLNTPCVATLTGATTTNTCTTQANVATGVWQFTIGTTANTTAGFSVDLSLAGTGTMATGTYALGSSLTGAVNVSQGSQMFQAQYENAAAGSVPLAGTATLDVTSFSTVAGQGASLLFPHGTLTASCPPSSGTGTAASISITF